MAADAGTAGLVAAAAARVSLWGLYIRWLTTLPSSQNPRVLATLAVQRTTHREHVCS